MDILTEAPVQWQLEEMYAHSIFHHSLGTLSYKLLYSKDPVGENISEIVSQKPV